MDSSPLTYPEELFESIANGFNAIFEGIKQSYTNVKLNGIWPFLYFEGANSLKSIKPVFIDKNIESNLLDYDKDELNKATINCDYGSIGFAFKSIRNSTELNYDKLYKTFNEPRGVVCYLDSKIKQEHAVFIAIRGSNNKILGLLDLFFNGDIEEESFSKFANDLYLKFNDDLLLKRLCINSFIIQQFYKLQQQSANELFATNPIKRIENILALSGNTPVFYFSYQNQICTHEYLGLNFDLLYGFVAHEYRFCGLVKRDIECYYKKQTTNQNLSCENSLLKNYYYDVIKENNLLSYRKDFNISGIDSKYIVEIIAKENELEAIDISCFSSVKGELDKFNLYKGLSDVAINKFIDEVVFSTLKNKIASNVSVLILYREVKRPYLIYSGNCCNKQLEINDKNKLKYFISPSELLHYQFSSEESEEPLLGRANSNDEEVKWDVVSFEILNKELFIESIKSKIADSPEKYCQSVIPYLDNETTDKCLKISDNFNQHKNLRLHFIGKDPTSGEDYKPIINEQISKIYGEFQTKEALKHATRAAISQLYARTDAHDLGHVLDALKSMEDIFSNETEDKQYNHKNHLTENTIIKNLTDKIASFKFCINSTEFATYSANQNKNTEKEYRFYPELIGFFIKFLKERMDFRADVATTDPNSLVTLDFYQDIFLPFNNNLIFNNRISGISDQKLKYCFIVKSNDLENARVKIPVAIPNDVLGCHAMYIILSNIIRNAVKHGELHPEKDVVFTININEYAHNKEFYEIKIFTNILKEKSDIDELVLQRNKTFNDTILNKETNRLRDSALGSIEMETCAAYLRKLPVTEVENEVFNLFENSQLSCDIKIDGKRIPKLLYAYAQEEQTNNPKLYSLGYKFYLLKPQEFLVVSDDPDETQRTLLNVSKIDFNKEGILFIKPVQLKNECYNHRFLVYMATSSSLNNVLTKYEESLSSIPKRKIEIQKNFCNLLAFQKECWEKWNKQFNKKIKLHYLNESYEFGENSISVVNVKLYNHAGNLTISDLFNGGYNEMICGHHWAKRKITENFAAAKDTVWMHYYLDSIFTNLIIIDERIQKSIVLQAKQYGGKIPFAPYFENIGIFIPSPSIDENKTNQLISNKTSYINDHSNDPNLNSKILSLEKGKIKDYISKYSEKSHFIVIHLGVIEKILDNKTDEKNPKMIENTIMEIVPSEEDRKKIVITSGRGKPNNLPDKYSFVPISLIQNAIETTYDKYRLVQILYNSRKSIL